MKKLLSVFVVILILVVVSVFAYTSVPAVQEKVTSITDEDFVDGNIYSDLAGVTERLEEEIIKGSDSFVIYLKGINVDEISKINDGTDQFFGSGESYMELGKVGDSYTKVEITVKKNTNYYVYDAIVNGKPIPQGDEKAKALYNRVKEVLKSTVHEGMTDYEKEIALHDYVVTDCMYSEDVNQSPESDIFRAYGALVNKIAVCNGYAEALQLLFMCCGVNSRFVIGTAGDESHAWNLVELDGKWYHLDATWDDPLPDRGADFIHAYCNISDEVIENSHTWDRSKYPEADSMDYNYYVRCDTYFSSFDDYREPAYNEMVNEGKPRYEAVIENYDLNEDDMQFVFKDTDKYHNVEWRTVIEGKYRVLVLWVD